MIELKGKYNTAKVFNDNVEAEAVSQIENLLNQPFTEGSSIRFMPDVHAGAGCTIGTTMTILDKVVPNIVGVDVSCGMLVAMISARDLNIANFKKLNTFILARIPSGVNVRTKAHRFSECIDLRELRCANYVNLNRAAASMGTLGGGNHFIEMNKDDDGNIYLVIHTGSRNLGKQVCEYYQNLAWTKLNNVDVTDIIKELKADGREIEIQSVLEKRNKISTPKELAFLTGQDTEDYLHDMKILQQWADLNRKAIADDIIAHMSWEPLDSFTSTHNYVSDRMIRKGAVSAQLGEVLLIPMNMRDGSLLCVGKGNPDWNYSAPHGAGRLMSRSKAKETLSLEKYAEDMKQRGIYTTSVCQATLDECADAYKPMEEIIENIKDTVDIVKIIKPVYNYKDSSEFHQYTRKEK